MVDLTASNQAKWCAGTCKASAWIVSAKLILDLAGHSSIPSHVVGERSKNYQYSINNTPVIVVEARDDQGNDNGKEGIE